MLEKDPKLKTLPFACVHCDPSVEGYENRKKLGEFLPDGKYICMKCGEKSEVKTIIRKK